MSVHQVLHALMMSTEIGSEVYRHSDRNFKEVGVNSNERGKFSGLLMDSQSLIHH